MCPRKESQSLINELLTKKKQPPKHLPEVFRHESFQARSLFGVFCTACTTMAAPESQFMPSLGKESKFRSVKVSDRKSSSVGIVNAQNAYNVVSMPGRLSSCVSSAS